MTASSLTLSDAKARGYKMDDSWWTVLLVDPLAIRLVRVADRFHAITPNRLTVAAFVVGLGSAVLFIYAGTNRWWLALGALAFHISFVIDCMDGKLARIQGSGSAFGEWFDYTLDRLRVLICAVALMGGQYMATGSVAYLYAGMGVIFLDMFRYLNALQIHRIRSDAGVQKAAADLQDFRSRFGRFAWLSDFLARARIRPHLFSGIEFQMFVFIIGPMTASILPVTAFAAAMLLLFECGISYKLWLAVK